MALPDPRKLAREHNTEVRTLDDQVRRELLGQYNGIKMQLRRALANLEEQMRSAFENSVEINASWLYQEQRLQSLLVAVEGQLLSYSMGVAVRLTKGQRTVVDLAERHARAQLQALGITGTFTHLPVAAIEDLVGRSLHYGTPLRTVLDRYPAIVGQEIRTVLTQGLALGYSPRKVAKSLEVALDGKVGRYLMLARTEMLGSYRAASLSSYRQNKAVESWSWLLGRPDKACSFCRGKAAGGPYSLLTPFNTHPSCRCTPRPVTRSLQEMGFR